MANRKHETESKAAAAAQPDGAPAAPVSKDDLPAVDSPPISPAGDSFVGPVKPAPAIEIDPATAIAGEPAKGTKTKSVFRLTPRRKRAALLAASVFFAAGIGAVIGAAANAHLTLPAKVDTAALGERKATQRTIAHLSRQLTAVKAASLEAASKAQKEIAALKTSLDAANKTASAQLGKVTERIDHMERQAKAAAAAPETTGSISARHAASGAKASETEKSQIVPGWFVRAARNGFIYVQGRGGIYRVVPGTPLPGLGTVETIKRRDGRWVVVTPKGIIVSMRERPYYAPY